MKLRQSLLLLALIFGLNACKKEEQPAPEVDYSIQKPELKPYVADNSFKIVAYMPSYRDPATIPDVKYKMITHLFYAFLEPQAEDGSLKPLSQQTRFYAIAKKAKANNVKFGISISGNKTILEKLSKNETSRKNFIDNIVTFAINNTLDGVDMDWEYPSTTTGIESADNYTLLMKQLSVELHKVGKFLSAAVTPAVYTGGIRDGIKPEVFPAIDFFNIMQYDGQKFDTDDPNQHASYKMSVYSLDVWLSQKNLPKQKAVIGIPLFGRSAVDAPITTKSVKEFDAAGLNLNDDMVTLAGVHYWFNGINMVKLKAKLAKEKANGIMFWEFSYDANGANSLIKAANDQLGRSY